MADVALTEVDDRFGKAAKSHKLKKVIDAQVFKDRVCFESSCNVPKIHSVVELAATLRRWFLNCLCLLTRRLWLVIKIK